jgi:hypothetical protein
VCIYILVSVYIWQIVFIQTAVLAWEGSEGKVSSGLPLFQGVPPGGTLGYRMPVSRVLRYVTQFHFGLWLWQLRIVSDSKLLLIIYTGFVWYCMSAYNVLSVCVTYRHK